MDWIAHMMKARVGHLRGTREQLAVLGRCNIDQASMAIEEIKNTVTARIDESNGVVTLTSRRLKREENARNMTKLRVIKHRCNGDVTPFVTHKVPSDSSSGSTSPPDQLPLEKGFGEKPSPVAPPPLPKQASGVSALGRRVAVWFKRRPETRWSEKEIKALREVESFQTPEEDIALLESRYLANAPYIRHDLVTLLNNWNGEIDRCKNERTTEQQKKVIDYSKGF